MYYPSLNPLKLIMQENNFEFNKKHKSIFVDTLVWKFFGFRRKRIQKGQLKKSDIFAKGVLEAL